jgi:diguanylate cyclase (GGDEF)-like protein/PAS domain S-box-containing protein
MVKEALEREGRTRGRERLLRDVGLALVAARTPEAAHGAALAAVLTLLPAEASARASIWRREGSVLHAVAAAGHGADLVRGTVLPRDELPSAIKRAITTGGMARITPDMPASARPKLAYPDKRAGTLVVALSTQDDVLGALVISSDLPIFDVLEDTLVAIASQVALAIESDELTADLHRRQNEERFGSLIANASDVITVVSEEHIVLYQTPSITRVLGHAPDALLGEPITDIIHPDDRPTAAAFLNRAAQLRDATATAEWRAADDGGAWHDLEVVAGNLTKDAQVHGIVLTSRDVSERKALERQLVHQAFHDSLTGLPNRALFRDRAEHALCGRHRPAIAVLFIDIDDFKNINDTLGHAAGDRMLTLIADRLRSCVRPGDTAARLGGDEFALLLENVEDASFAIAAAHRLLGELTQPLPLATRDVIVHASIGVAAPTSDSADAEVLLRNADIAMYAAKAGGKNCVRVFEPAMYARTLNRVELEHDLMLAAQNGQLRLQYQPIVDLDTGRPVGAEALVRWQHPDRGLLPPNDFIGLAEETGTIVAIGHWVLHEACRQLQAWRREDSRARSMTISINLSAGQLGDPGVVDDVANALREHDLEPEALVLEITESTVMKDLELAIARLDELAALRVRLALDDFGTGYSSLSYLQRFPLHVLKLDQSFTTQLTADTDEPPLPGAIIELARTLGLEVIAEGVEEEHQHLRLRELGCHLAQGYRFARPLAPIPALAYITQTGDRSS